MCDKKNGTAGFQLDAFEQIDHLRLNGDIQGADRLIGDNQLRLHNQGPGDSHALALSAGKLVRIPAGVFRRKADLL